MELESPAWRSAIEKSLLDFHRSPGQYALMGRQPALLFSSIKEVLQLASGRAPNGDDTHPPAEPVRLAACFFIRSALLHPNADHYALLGLNRDTETVAVKDRYRLMMRLMHPDFANALSSVNWPADAATRVNRAYEILSSPARRQAYDEELNPAVVTRATHADTRAASRVSPAMKAAEPKPAEDPRRRLKRLATVFGAAGGLALLGALFSNGQPDKETLVQRSILPEPPQAPRAQAVAIGDAVPSSAEVAAPTAAERLPEPAQLSAVAAPAVVAPAIEQPEPKIAEPTRTFAVAAARAPIPVPVAATSPPVVKAPVAAPVAPASVAAVPARTTPQLIARAPVAAPTIQTLTAPIAATQPAVTRAVVVAAPPAAAAAPALLVATAPAPAPATPIAAAMPAPTPQIVTQVMAAAPAPAPAPAPTFRPQQPAAPTMAEVHPLLSRLLQQLESGWGDRVVDLLDHEGRNSPGAQALLQQYNGLVDGMRPIKLSNAQFKAEPRDGRLLVTGRVQILGREAAATRELAVLAEFAARDGKVVMTRLAPVRD